MACSKCEATRRAILSKGQKMGDVTSRFMSWIKKPYDDDMTAIDWFLFIGLIIVIIVAWSSILRKVLD